MVSQLPNMDEMNLALLKRRDQDAEQILGSSAHVTMYIMSVESQKWERRNVEGTLYIVKRRSNPRFQLVVLNKLSTENYVETIESGFHAEVSPPYLIYTQGGGKVHGVWFFEEADLPKIAALLAKVESGLPKAQVPVGGATEADTTSAPSQAVGGGDDVGFWDKQPPQRAPPPTTAQRFGAVATPPSQLLPPPPPPPPQTDQTSGNAVLNNLFKTAQLKHQQQAGVLATSPQAPGLSPLPPSFFQQQQQAQQQQQQSPPPASKDADAAKAAFKAPTDNENPITKFFYRQQSTPSQPPQLATPATSGALAALFDNATSKSGSLSVAPVQSTGAALSPQLQQPPQLPPSGSTRAPVDDRLRIALMRLVNRDDFVSILAEELRSVGLMTR